MNLEPSEDQYSIAASAADFLASELPLSRVRELGEKGDGDAIDDATWQQCAALGWLSLGIPENRGGVGLGLPEETMLFRELGRHLTPGPFRSTVLAGHLALGTGAEALAAEIASGAKPVGLSLGRVAIDARADGLVLVLDGDSAAIRRVVDSEPVAGVDPGTRFARISTGDTVAEAQAAALIDRARVLAAAELLGIIEAVRDMSAEYAKTRIQFDKAIGTFQAVKHRCADMAIAAYSVIGEVFQAAVLVDAGTVDAAFHAANAYVLALRGAKTSTTDNIQNLGGIGFTWEQDAHLYLKRALLLEHHLGPLRDAYQTILAPAKHEF